MTRSQYQLYDVADEQRATGTVSISITGVNDAPVAMDETEVVLPGESISINVTENDTDEDTGDDIDPSSIIITTQPASGSLIVRNDGTIDYIADATFSVMDTFSYTVADSFGQQSEPATVTVGEAVLPETVADIGGGAIGDDMVQVDVVGNDIGEFDLSSIIIETQPQNGVVTVLADGTLQYEPTAPFTGEDTFSYSIADVFGRRSAPSFVTVKFVESGRQNPVEFFDVDANGIITPADALSIINKIDADQDVRIEVGPNDRGPDYWDTSGNRIITPGDAIDLINWLAANFGQNEMISTPTQPVQFVSDTIEIGTNLNRNGSQFEPEMPAELLPSETSNDRVIANSTLTQEADTSFIDLMVDESDDESDEDTLAAVDEVFIDLF